MPPQRIILVLLVFALSACAKTIPATEVKQPTAPAAVASAELTISRAEYRSRMHGFWLAQCIANFTGRVTEMDKIGDTADKKTLPFYTRSDWGKPDQPAIWGEGKPSDLSATIYFVFRGENEVWNADDDTDIEYIYQYLLRMNKTSMLTPEQIRDGWITHIKKDEENFLWGGNQETFNLMQKGVLPPDTSAPDKNPNWYFIDAQLTTEIFGLYAPGRPDVALRMSHLPIRAVAYEDAAWIADFYVIMHALASTVDPSLSRSQQLQWLAQEARVALPDDSYSAKMYEFVFARYRSGQPWEQTRDEVYQRYQIEHADGYDIPGKDTYCDACFAAGINFAASLISLLYGEGDLLETIKIGTLVGWDSDNPTSTWGGLLGFMLGKDGVEKAFGRTFSNQFNIHHTRQGFPNNGMDTFENMADGALEIIDRAVQNEMGGTVNTAENAWRIPLVRP